MGEQSGPVLAREELPPRLTIVGEVIFLPAMLLKIAMQRRSHSYASGRRGQVGNVTGMVSSLTIL